MVVTTYKDARADQTARPSGSDRRRLVHAQARCDEGQIVGARTLAARVSVVAALLSFLVAGCVTPIEGVRPYAECPFEPDETTTVTVQANQMWQPSGLVFERGDELFFEAEGKWKYDWAQEPCSAAGVNGHIGQGFCIVKNVPLGSLVGKIGGGLPFPIGVQGYDKVSNEGPLFLSLNDSDIGFGDNSGGIEVTVSYRRDSPSVGEPAVPLAQVERDTERPGLGQRWAVLVGISDYKYRGKWGLTNLRYASRDATVLADYLRSPQGGQFDHVILLTDQDATVRNVKVALREKLREVQPEDLVVLFWSGHGTSDPHEPAKLYLVGHDSDPEHMASTGYAMGEFQADIGSLRSHRVVVLADACHSAGLSDPSSGTRGDAENKIGNGLKAIAVEATDDAAVPASNQTSVSVAPRFHLIFTSCEAGEISMESSQLGGGHGVFTYYLLEALNGAADRMDANGDADGRVSLGEMIDYTSDRVRRFSQNRQHPDTAGRFDRNVMIGIAE